MNLQGILLKTMEPRPARPTAAEPQARTAQPSTAQRRMIPSHTAWWASSAPTSATAPWPARSARGRSRSFRAGRPGPRGLTAPGPRANLIDKKRGLPSIGSDAFWGLLIGCSLSSGANLPTHATEFESSRCGQGIMSNPHLFAIPGLGAFGKPASGLNNRGGPEQGAAFCLWVGEECKRSFIGPVEKPGLGSERKCSSSFLSRN